MKQVLAAATCFLVRILTAQEYFYEKYHYRGVRAKALVSPDSLCALFFGGVFDVCLYGHF
jgi:hypothetical protein